MAIFSSCGYCGSPHGTECTKECEEGSVPNDKVKWCWCNQCEEKLVPELDAYWGRDEFLGKLCYKCRKSYEQGVLKII